MVALHRRYEAALLRVAAGDVGSHALAEEVVEDTWRDHRLLAVKIIPALESDTEPELAHDSSTNALIRRYRNLKSEEQQP